MRNKPNAEYVWKQLEDVVDPRMRLSVIERALCYHPLRHCRLEGKPVITSPLPHWALVHISPAALCEKRCGRCRPRRTAVAPTKQNRARGETAGARGNPRRPVRGGHGQRP
jgi:hypothetical protein